MREEVGIGSHRQYVVKYRLNRRTCRMMFINS